MLCIYYILQTHMEVIVPDVIPQRQGYPLVKNDLRYCNREMELNKSTNVTHASTTRTEYELQYCTLYCHCLTIHVQRVL